MRLKEEKTIWNSVGNGIILLFYMIYGMVCTVLFFLQSIQYQTSIGNYRSDLPAHIKFGDDGTGYSLMSSIFALFHKMTSNYYIFIAVFLSLIVLATVFITYKLMRYLSPDGNSILLHFGAIICNFVTAIYLPMFNSHRYLGVQSGNLYHNSTYTGMKLVGIFVIMLYFSYMQKYENGLNWRQWTLFAVSLIILNLVKSNLFICFAPAMAVYLLFDLIKKKGKTFPQIFIFGLAVIPSVIVLIYQYMILFPAGESSSGFIIDIGYSLSIRSETPWLAPIQTLAFPLWVLIFHIKDLKKDRRYGFTWTMTLISFLEYLVFCESGARKRHGNLAWGFNFCIFLAFVFSVVQILKDIKNHKETPRPKIYYIVAGLLLLWHFICGLQYFYFVISGGSYLK